MFKRHHDFFLYGINGMFASHYAEIIGQDPHRSPIPAAATKYPLGDDAYLKREAFTLDPRVRVVTTEGVVRRVFRREQMSADMRVPTPPMLAQQPDRRAALAARRRPPPILRKERFEPDMVYPDEYNVYTPYISEKSPVPHLNPPLPYPSLSRNILPGTTTRYEDVGFSEPYWYRHYTPATYEETWEYNINDQREYYKDMARARRMRNLV